MPDFGIPPELIEHLNRGDCVLFLGTDLPREVTGLSSRADLAQIALGTRAGSNLLKSPSRGR